MKSSVSSFCQQLKFGTYIFVFHATYLFTKANRRMDVFTKKIRILTKSIICHYIWKVMVIIMPTKLLEAHEIILLDFDKRNMWEYNPKFGAKSLRNQRVLIGAKLESFKKPKKRKPRSSDLRPLRSNLKPDSESLENSVQNMSPRWYKVASKQSLV